jgi:hypothetical protein
MQMPVRGIDWAKNVFQGAGESATGDPDSHVGKFAYMFTKTVRSIELR